MTEAENSTRAPAEAESALPETRPEPAEAVVTGGPESDAAAEPSRPDGQGTAETESGADTPADDAPVDAGLDQAGFDAASVAAERPAPVTDEVLLASVDVARAALLEVTPESTIGNVVGHAAEDDHVLSLFFDSRLPGYPGWHWTVTLARVGDDGAPTILETELMPGENALLAPDWVPWSERLADYQASQEVAENEARILAEALLDEGDDDDEDDDEFSILHAGDVDGVDVDEIDDSAEIDDDLEDDDADDDDADDESDDDDSDDDDYGNEGPERSY